MNLWSLKFVILTALQALSVALCDSVLSTSAEGSLNIIIASSVVCVCLGKSEPIFIGRISSCLGKDLCTCVGHGLIKCEDEKNRSLLSMTVQHRPTAKQKHYGTTVPLQLVGKEWKPTSQLPIQ
ncbi:hypothetical protein KUCAC02_027246, partial [Chaenocephalus aceratus]